MIKLETDKIYSVSDAPEILKEAIKGGKCYKSKTLQYYNIITAFDIETSNFKSIMDESYKVEYIYNYIKGIKLMCPDSDRKSLPGISISKTDGQPLDTFYQELVSMFPGFIKDGIIDPDGQLSEIIRLYQENAPTPENETKYSIMYCWQFAINGKVIFGRYWNEFLYLIDLIGQYTDIHNRLICYVHSLSHEFQYIRTLMQWHKVFSIDTRKPIYAITESGIEFRCSYILTNYNLENLGKQLRKYDIKKLVGNLDYSLIRTPETLMSEEEIAYCINDVLVVSAYIQECILTEGKIANIPLTATGYCRRYCRKMCLYGTSKKYKTKQYNHYMAIMQGLKIDGKEEYMQLRRAFQGGFTHCASRWSGKTAYNCDSIDESSAYPFSALCELMPMSRGKIVKPKSKEEFDNYLDKYLSVFDVEFKEIQATFDHENYISASHCFIKENAVRNNGRIYSADRICMTITNIDLDIIRRTYSYKSMKVKNMRIYRKGFLPKELLQAIIKLYKDKTILKGVIGKEAEYGNAKALLNSVY